LPKKIQSNIRVGKKSKDRADKEKSAINLDNSNYQIDLTNPNIQLNKTQTPTNINFQLNNSICPVNDNNTIKLYNNTEIENKKKNFFDIKMNNDEFFEKIKYFD